MSCDCEEKVRVSSQVMGIAHASAGSLDDAERRRLAASINAVFDNRFPEHAWVIERPSVADCRRLLPFLASREIPHPERAVLMGRSNRRCVTDDLRRLGSGDDILDGIVVYPSDSPEIAMLAQWGHTVRQLKGAKRRLALALIPYWDLSKTGNTLPELIFWNDFIGLDDDFFALDLFADFLERYAQHGDDAASRAASVRAYFEQEPDDLGIIDANCFGLWGFEETL
jgi:hypothetical protein